jgi:hypothetical protein
MCYLNKKFVKVIRFAAMSLAVMILLSHVAIVSAAVNLEPAEVAETVKVESIPPIAFTLENFATSEVVLYCEDSILDSSDTIQQQESEEPESETSEPTSPLEEPSSEPVQEEPIQEEPVKILEDSPILFNELNYEVSYNLIECNDFLVKLQNALSQLTEAINSENYTTEACRAMEQEIIRLESFVAKTESDIKDITDKQNEYYYATKTWEFLTAQGYNEVVTSAIIGNMMIETSGGTLALNPYIYNSTGIYYGLCQWLLKYNPEIADTSFEYQLDYLISNIEAEFNTFGNCYYQGFNYESFLSMTDPAEAALAFAKVYERCGSGSYRLRQDAAWVAYNYFNIQN